MTNILHIDSSLFGANGNSSQLGAELVRQLQASLGGADVLHRNLAESPIPHLSLETLTHIGEGKAELADELIAELKAADILVLGVPMYNFGVPSSLKAWIDHIARAGSTFKYTETGPVGLLENKKAYVVTARGGIHKGKPSDVESDFIKIVLNFIGITDVTFIYAEGLNMGDHKATALTQAKDSIAAAVEKFASDDVEGVLA